MKRLSAIDSPESSAYRCVRCHTATLVRSNVCIVRAQIIKVRLEMRLLSDATRLRCSRRYHARKAPLSGRRMRPVLQARRTEGQLLGRPAQGALRIRERAGIEDTGRGCLVHPSTQTGDVRVADVLSAACLAFARNSRRCSFSSLTLGAGMWRCELRPRSATSCETRPTRPAILDSDSVIGS